MHSAIAPPSLSLHRPRIQRTKTRRVSAAQGTIADSGPYSRSSRPHPNAAANLVSHLDWRGCVVKLANGTMFRHGVRAMSASWIGIMFKQRSANKPCYPIPYSYQT